MLLTIFIISAFLAAVILLSKNQEVKTGRPTFVGSFLAKGDPKILAVSQSAQQIFNNHWDKTFLLFLVHIPGRIEAFLRKFRTKAHDYYHGINTKVRDQRELTEDAVSPYMRSMTMNRESGDAR